jgi:hypothetical protein
MAVMGKEIRAGGISDEKRRASTARGTRSKRSTSSSKHQELGVRGRGTKIKYPLSNIQAMLLWPWANRFVYGGISDEKKTGIWSTKASSRRAKQEIYRLGASESDLDLAESSHVDRGDSKDCNSATHSTPCDIQTKCKPSSWWVVNLTLSRGFFEKISSLSSRP